MDPNSGEEYVGELPLSDGKPDFKVHVIFYRSSLAVSLMNPVNGIMLRDAISRSRAEALLKHLEPLKGDATLSSAQFAYEVERRSSNLFHHMRAFAGFVSIDKSAYDDPTVRFEEAMRKLPTDPKCWDKVNAMVNDIIK
jgi:hypothetical protein